MKLLRQSEARNVRVGPVVDLSGNILEGCTQLTRIRKNDGRGLVKGPMAVYDSDGYCRVSLSGDDTDTVGPLMIRSDDHLDRLPFWNTFEVLPTDVMDSLGYMALQE